MESLHNVKLQSATEDPEPAGEGEKVAGPAAQDDEGHAVYNFSAFGVGTGEEPEEGEEGEEGKGEGEEGKGEGEGDGEAAAEGGGEDDKAKRRKRSLARKASQDVAFAPHSDNADEGNDAAKAPNLTDHGGHGGFAAGQLIESVDAPAEMMGSLLVIWVRTFISI